MNTKHLGLADEEIHGNGHLQFLEENNLEVVEVLERWNGTIQCYVETPIWYISIQIACDIVLASILRIKDSLLRRLI